MLKCWPLESRKVPPASLRLRRDSQKRNGVLALPVLMAVIAVAVLFGGPVWANITAEGDVPTVELTERQEVQHRDQETTPARVSGRVQVDVVAVRDWAHDQPLSTPVITPPSRAR